MPATVVQLPVVVAVVAVFSTLQPSTVAHVDKTRVVVVIVFWSDVDTPYEVFVAHSSAVSVLQPLSGPLRGLGGNFGTPSGPILETLVSADSHKPSKTDLRELWPVWQDPADMDRNGRAWIDR